MADDDDVIYDDTHRAFLQAFLARSPLTVDQARPILAEILSVQDTEREVLPNDITNQDFSDYVTTLNKAISPFDLEIRSTIPQEPRTSSTDGDAADGLPRVYSIVNTSSDPVTQLATTHSAEEIAYLKRVLDAMFETYNTADREVMALTSIQALQLNRAPNEANADANTPASANAGLTKAEAERTLDTLVQEGWLSLSSKGYYRLSSRALMELRAWLLETYNSPADPDNGIDEAEEKVKLCHGCKEIVIVGQRCADLDCSVRVHDFCLRNVLRAGGGDKCPKCKRTWTNDAFVGEKAASARRSTGGTGGRRSTAVTNGTTSDNG